MQRILSLFLAFLCCLFSVSGARGSLDTGLSPLPQNGNYLRFDDNGLRTGSGGPFLGRLSPVAPSGANGSARVNDVNTNWNNTWYTFCVEAGGEPGSEPITLYNGSSSNQTIYRVLSTSTSIATATGNVVTNAAKYLYYAWGNDLIPATLGSFSFSNLNAANNQDLQIAIWSLVYRGANDASLVDTYSPYNPSNGWLTNVGFNAAQLEAQLRTWAIQQMNDPSKKALAQRVRIVNPDLDLNSMNGQNQSMLYVIPEASTLAVWSLLSLVGLAAYRWRGTRS